EAAPAAPGEAGRQPAAGHPPRARSDDRPPRPARPAHRAPAAKPRTREPVRPEPRPAPRRSYDMAPLCEAARGVVDPAIAALCR
ncbi:hypothetical protein AB0E73_34475, partial [Streptomyces sp. NPDC031705]